MDSWDDYDDDIPANSGSFSPQVNQCPHCKQRHLDLDATLWYDGTQTIKLRKLGSQELKKKKKRGSLLEIYEPIGKNFVNDI